jgi:hypothetical protein
MDYVGDVIEELEGINKSRACLAALSELEADETTVARQIRVSASALLGIIVQTGVDDARDFGMPLLA